LDFTSLDDVALLGLIAAEHSEALGALYDRYGRLVYTIAIHVVGDGETAEEITQDVFVRVWEGAGSYRPDMAKVTSWLVSIARHRSIDELRRRGVRPEKDSFSWPEESGAEIANGLPVLEGPEDEVESALRNQRVRQAVATLSVDQRTVLGLAYFQGLSHSEIAERLGQPLGTVKSRIRIAMQKLRDVMAEPGSFDQ
jgi:RNA polymerase sigma-70 factor (ECF subfamily)